MIPHRSVCSQCGCCTPLLLCWPFPHVPSTSRRADIPSRVLSGHQAKNLWGFSLVTGAAMGSMLGSRLNPDLIRYCSPQCQSSLGLLLWAAALPPALLLSRPLAGFVQGKPCAHWWPNACGSSRVFCFLPEPALPQLRAHRSHRCLCPRPSC